MISKKTSAGAFLLCLLLAGGSFSGDTAAPAAVKSENIKTSCHAVVSERPSSDTLVIIARCIEIPGKFAPNDLYNYVYIMKYRVMKVLKGSYPGREILVGHYNPLMPRRNIKDKMAPLARGNAEKFETGVKHSLVLITPIDKVWKDAVEDDYADSDMEKYYALKADTLK